MHDSTRSAAARIRILIATATCDDAGWADWQAARQASPSASRITLQRVTRSDRADSRSSVGIGYRETLRWFDPIDDAESRRLIIEYADAVLEADGFPRPQPELSRFVCADASAQLPADTAAIADGILFLSHADTDLLAIERARPDLPPGFPAISSNSLMALATAERLLAQVGARRSPQLLVIVRVHGTVDSVPGLGALIGLAHQEGWGLVVISGVGGGVELLPRTSNIDAQFASNLTAYFMSGGVANVTQALRYAAAEFLRFAVAFEPPQPMPAHGLYHPDLLVTGPAEWDGHRAHDRPTAVVLFYRAHVLSGNLQFVDVLVRSLEQRGFAAVGVFTSTLRDRDGDDVPVALGMLGAFPDVVVNTVNFPLFMLSSLERAAAAPRRSFEFVGAPLVQAICCGTPRRTWDESVRGLNSTEAAISIALPECDGRVISVPISFKEDHRYVPEPERVARVANFARRLAILRKKPNGEKRVAIVLSNAGGKAQRIGGAVGLDTPASLLRCLVDMRAAGYDVGLLPASAGELMESILARGCYDERHPVDPLTAERMPRARYVRWFSEQSPRFQQAMRDAWGEPTPSGPTIARPFWRAGKKTTFESPLLALHEPHTDDDDYLFGALRLGNVLIAIQPQRGFGVDPEAIYHAPDLPPCHHYAAFYRWLADDWRCDAIVHFGTHGTLEWLPGKSVAMSADCAPDALLGDLPLIYPFVINNPGEGAQAKRRTHAIIVDHLVPPLSRADAYGPLATLARLIDEYYRAEVLDTSKLPILRRQIWDLVRDANLEDDLRQIRLERHGGHVHQWDERVDEQGVPRALTSLSGRGFAHLLEDLDAYLCDLGRAQIRCGLHVFGVPPAESALVDMLFAILRNPNGDVPSLVDTMARANGVDPAELRDRQGVWTGALGGVLADRLGAVATIGQVRAAIDELAREFLRAMASHGFSSAPMDLLVREGLGPAGVPNASALADLDAIARFVCETLAPNLARTTDETRNLLGALNGAYVPAGPSGSPSRGMAHVLPTGRNFYTVDPRGLPTPAAWTTGMALAREALSRHFAEKARWPESIALSIWGTPTLRTGGDDVAQALALLGVRPIWDPETRVARDLEIIPLFELDRPRIDVTLRVSGFFRDAFPALMKLFDEAVQRVRDLDEPVEHNYVRKHCLAEVSMLRNQGIEEDVALRRASYRVFSSKPGAYGTGLMQLMDGGTWRDRGDLAEAVLVWGGWAYSRECSDGVEAVETFRRKLAGIDLVLQNQDNVEQDLFDSSDFFEFQGGLVSAVTTLSNSTPAAYFGDSSDPARPAVRTLQAEALRVYRSRVVNPKWLDAMARHGYRGGLEMAATVDALFGFSATAGIVTDWMFEGIAESFADGEARRFLQRDNPWALNAIVERLLEADQRQLWTPKPDTLEKLRAALLDNEASLEDATAGLP